jgi:hypothetical protein
VLTVIQIRFTGAARVGTIGLYTVVLSLGAVFGQIGGGVLVSANLFGATWRPVFLVNVPLDALVIVLAGRALPADPPVGRGHLDWRGVLTLWAALLLLIVPLVLGPDAGWPLWARVGPVASVPAFAAFWAAERRSAERGVRSVINPRLLAGPGVGWGAASVAAAASTYFETLFAVALYLQRGLRHSAPQWGVALVAWVAAFGLAGAILPRRSHGGQRRAAPGGALRMAAGFAAVAVAVAADDTGLGLLLALLGLCGLGYGLCYRGTTLELTRAVTANHAADLSGLIQTANRVGAVIGVGGFGAAYLALAPRPGPAVAAFAFARLAGALALVTLGGAGMAYTAGERSSVRLALYRVRASPRRPLRMSPCARLAGAATPRAQRYVSRPIVAGVLCAALTADLRGGGGDNRRAAASLAGLAFRLVTSRGRPTAH